MTDQTTSKLVYTDKDGAKREVEGCSLTVDKFDRHWIWCEQRVTMVGS